MAARHYYLTGTGTLAIMLANKFVELCNVVGEDGALAIATTDFNSVTVDQIDERMRALLGDRWLAPTIGQITDATGFQGDHFKAKRTRHLWGPLVNNMAEFIRQDALQAGQHTPLGMHIFGPPSGGHFYVSQVYMGELARRQTTGVHLGITTLPEEDGKRRKLGRRMWHDYLERMRTMGKMDAILVMDNRSPLARREHYGGYEYQDELLMHGLVGMLLSQSRFPTGWSAADMIKLLSDYAPYIGASFGVRSVAALPREVKQKSWWEKAADALTGNQEPEPPPRFDPDDLQRQVIEAIKTALYAERWRGIEMDKITRDAPIFVILSVPLPMDDAELWKPLRPDIMMPFIGEANQRDNLNFIIAPGMNGPRHPMSPADWRVGAMVLAPMREVLPLEQIREREARSLWDATSAETDDSAFNEEDEDDVGLWGDESKR